MVLSIHQVDNVLKVYKNQLRQGKTSQRNSGNARPTPDRISISGEAKRKLIVEQIAADIASRITQNGPQNPLEKEVVAKLENAYDGCLGVPENGSSDLIFKSIDEDGETIKSISIEDSEFLAHKLQDIARETVENIQEERLETL